MGAYEGKEITVSVTVKPGKATTAFFDRDGELIVELNAQAKDNEANNELVRAMAKALKIAKSDVTLVSGAKNRNKVLACSGISAPEAIAKLKFAAA